MRLGLSVRVSLALTTVFMLSLRAQPQSPYRVTDLGTLPGYTESHAYGINNRGQVVGAAFTAGVLPRAVLWDKGEMIDLGVLPGDTYSAAWAINDTGQVVGDSFSAWTLNGFLWYKGAMFKLDPLADAPST